MRINPFCLEIPPAADHRRERPGTVVYVGSFLPANVDAAIWLVDDIMPRLRVCLPASGCDRRRGSPRPDTAARPGRRPFDGVCS